MVDFDDAGSIGKRYRRQDEIGTPLCITVDFQTVGDDSTPADQCVTVRAMQADKKVFPKPGLPLRSKLPDFMVKLWAYRRQV